MKETHFPGWIFRALTLSAVVALGAACDSGPVIPPEDFQPIGSWHAVLFTAQAGTELYDLLELGGSISLQLLENGALAGTYIVPDFADQAGDELQIVGTWTRPGRTSIRFEHSGQSYLRRMPFTGGGDQMTATAALDGMTITVVLAR